MTLWAIVPVKPLRRGKSRLADVFSEDERTDLNRYLLENTVRTLKRVPQIEHVLVVSRDPSALALARDLGARTVLENGAPHLNVALTRATVVARSYAARGVLILPSDLPLVSEEDVHLMIERAAEPPVVVVAPDRHRRGTNALLVSPAGLIEYHYGEASFEKHCRLAEAAGARLEVCELSSLTLDLDVPEDLDLLENSLEMDITSDQKRFMGPNN